MLTKLKLIYWRWVKSCCERDIEKLNAFIDRATEDKERCTQPGVLHRSVCQAMREQRQALKDYRNAVNVIEELERQVR